MFRAGGLSRNVSSWVRLTWGADIIGAVRTEEQTLLLHGLEALTKWQIEIFRNNLDELLALEESIYYSFTKASEELLFWT